MALLADYTAGTITVSANGTAVTGTGTAWQTAGFKEGDWLIANGWVNVIASVNSNTSLTLAQPWRGGALSGAAYRLRYMSDGSRASAQARQLIDLLGGSGNLEAIAGLAGAANTLAYFTGAGTMSTTPLTAFARSLLDDANGAAMYATLGQIPNAQVRNDLTPDKAFRRGNILGTVSQSGGQPTGAVIERGSNSNGGYVRFADGTQICWRADFTAIRSNPARITETWTFPAAFSATVIPLVTMPYFNSQYVDCTVEEIGNVSAGTGTTTAVIGLRKVASAPDWPVTAVVNSIGVCAVGRWFN